MANDLYIPPSPASVGGSLMYPKEDFFKLRGKYSGKMSVDKFLEQKREDMKLERGG